jgi:hypothetical protein
LVRLFQRDLLYKKSQQRMSLISHKFEIEEKFSFLSRSYSCLVTIIMRCPLCIAHRTRDFRDCHWWHRHGQEVIEAGEDRADEIANERRYSPRLRIARAIRLAMYMAYHRLNGTLRRRPRPDLPDCILRLIQTHTPNPNNERFRGNPDRFWDGDEDEDEI